MELDILLSNILANASKTERNAYEMLNETNQTFSNIGTFKLKKFDKPFTIKVTKERWSGKLCFRKQDKNKYKGFTVSTVLTDDELSEIYGKYSDNDIA
ncbi:hypothetical protein MA9V2_227 [Chryseobacterium phage MA9V-2]|nr:hypothetical protein MA9V2_227 [Chryseobacterium phage MA9V-2]